MRVCVSSSGVLFSVGVCVCGLLIFAHRCAAPPNLHHNLLFPRLQQSVGPNLVPCPNLVLPSLEPPAHTCRALESCRHAGEGLPYSPVTSRGSSGAANDCSGEEYQVNARYQIRASALPHQATRGAGPARRLSLYKYCFSSRFYCGILPPFYCPSPRLQSPTYSNTIARPLRNIRSPTDPSCLCHTPYNIGDGTVV